MLFVMWILVSHWVLSYFKDTRIKNRRWEEKFSWPNDEDTINYSLRKEEKIYVYFIKNVYINIKG